jgi:hypothetical protein
VHLLYVDESGSHTFHGNLAYVLVGVAVRADHARALGRALDALVRDAVPEIDDDLLELHASELHDPRRSKASPWRAVDGRVRHSVVLGALELVARAGADGHLAIFVEVVPPARRSEVPAYRHMLHDFDDWLLERDSWGLVISDVSHNERVIRANAEQDTDHDGVLGRLTRLVDTPMFSDSLGSRLLQAADMVAWSSWRRFGCNPPKVSFYDIVEPFVTLSRQERS